MFLVVVSCGAVLFHRATKRTIIAYNSTAEWHCLGCLQNMQDMELCLRAHLVTGRVMSHSASLSLPKVLNARFMLRVALVVGGPL